MTDWTTHIDSNPAVLFGKPTIKNTRISVDLILEKIANGDTFDDLLEAYPVIKRESLVACLLFAANAIKNEVVFQKAS